MSDFREIVFSPLMMQGILDSDEFPTNIVENIAGDETDGNLVDGDKDGSTVFGASFNFVNSIVGAGIIGLTCCNTDTK
jgi:hypothetical protein